MDLKDLIEQGILKEHVRESEIAAPPTYTVLHQPKSCDDCSRIVTNRIVNSRRSHLPYLHYKTQCQVCKFYKNPETGEFDLDNSQIQYYYRHTHK